jgi:hypothetical protein
MGMDSRVWDQGGNINRLVGKPWRETQEVYGACIRKGEITLFFYFLNSFIHMCIHCLGHFSLCPQPPPSLSLPSPFQAEHVLPLYLILLKRRHKHNKEDKAFLLIELRIAIQRDS